ncbi:MAG: DUF975 family protein [Bacillota bacterium]|nr:DUF975 family protein [Bacillota bacterium]
MQQNMMGPNIIITEPSSSLRALGRNALAGKWQLAIIAVGVYYLCIELPVAILDALFGVNMGNLYGTSYGYMDVDIYSSIYNNLPEYSFLSGVYTLLVSGPLVLGVTLFFLAMFRRQQVEVTDIFLGFERFGKALGLYLFQMLFIFLWTLLLIVPGIIAAIRYSQAFFILADDPNKGIRQCMDESKMMMKGNKGKYFCLSLSFIGWLILSALPAGILEGIANSLYITGFMETLIVIIGGLFAIPVTAYMYSTFAGFYEILAGHLIKETEPAPVEPQAIPVAAQPQQESPQQASQEDIYAQPQAQTTPEEPVQAPETQTAPEQPAQTSEQEPQATPEEQATGQKPDEPAQP